jgi:hypothetical protein
MVVFIHRRKGFFYQWIISFIPRRNDGCFYPPEKVLFTDGFTSFITSWKRWLFLSNGERTFLPLNFLHYLVERMVVYPPEKRLVTNSFYLHTSSNPEVKGRIRPKNPESSTKA